MRNLITLFFFFFMCVGYRQFGPQQIITNEAINVEFVIPVDIDGDRDNDVLSASIVDYAAAWYENRTILSTPEVALNSAVIVFPNPSETTVTLGTGAQFFENVRVRDALVKQMEVHCVYNSCNVSMLSSGICLVNKTIDGKVFAERFIK
ncbi:MAG: hypothetical protein ACJA1Z_003899 [Patiriisocius sp.]|jgi:hypothetical protein